MLASITEMMYKKYRIIIYETRKRKTKRIDTVKNIAEYKIAAIVKTGTQFLISSIWVSHVLDCSKH